MFAEPHLQSMGGCSAPLAEHVPLADNGSPATPGAMGRWLTLASDVLGSNEHIMQRAREGDSLAVCFPRGWPAVYRESGALKALLKALCGIRCRAVQPASNNDMTTAATAGALHPLHSFSNASRLAAAVDGWDIVKGYQIFEVADSTRGSEFVAVRHWWIAKADNMWLDLTPPLLPDLGEARRVLVESTLGEKQLAPLTAAGREFARHFARRLLAGRASLASAQRSAVSKETAGSAAMHGQAARFAWAGDGEHQGGLSPEVPCDPTSFAAGIAARAEGDACYRKGKVEEADVCYERAIVPRIAWAEGAKAEGNEAFYAGDAAAAALKYESALAELSHASIVGLGSDQVC